MHRIEVTVTGETATGKSVIVAAIEGALKELGVRAVLSPELELERQMGNPDTPAPWELESLRKNSYVVLSEVNIPRKNQ
jgi:phage/plasmid-associated DNA primase